MDRRKLMMTGVVAGSVGVGSLVGAIAFAPGIGLAASGTGTGARAIAICAGAAGSLDAAADAIGVSPSELTRALRNGRTIAEVAGAHGVSVSTVVDEVVAAEQDRLDQLVVDGRLTREQADELSADLQERVTDLVNGDLAPFPLAGRPGFVGAPGLIGHLGLWGLADGPLAVAADAIGIDVDALLSALRDGDTIADAARAHEVAASEVVDAIVASMRQRLDAAVRDGWITRRDADRITADLEATAIGLVNGEHTMFPVPGWGSTGGRGTGTSTSELSLF